MTRIEAEIQRDAALRPTHVKVKGLKVDYEYYPSGAVSKVILSGRRASIPRLFSILDMIYPRDVIVRINSVLPPRSAIFGEDAIDLNFLGYTDLFSFENVGGGILKKLFLIIWEVEAIEIDFDKVHLSFEVDKEAPFEPTLDYCKGWLKSDDYTNPANPYYFTEFGAFKAQMIWGIPIEFQNSLRVRIKQDADGNATSATFMYYACLT